MLEKGKKGIKMIAERDFDRVERHLRNRFLDRQGRLLFVNCTSPEYADFNGETAISRIDDYGYPEYTTSINLCSDDDSFTINPPDYFTQLYFSVENILQIQSFDIKGEFKTTDGEKVTKQDQYRFPQGTNTGRSDDKRRSKYPVWMSFDENIKHGEVIISINNYNLQKKREKLLSEIKPVIDSNTLGSQPRISIPAARSQGRNTPIFWISVDTFRYDYLYCLEPVLNELGPEAVVPDEPRTQGHWTRPSHASTLTGVYPSSHGYVGGGSQIDPSLDTIASFLSDNMYKCSSIVTQPTLGPGFGFGKGFHRFERPTMYFTKRQYDARYVVDKTLKWVNEDTKNDHTDLFYFLHMFDAHAPYMPPESYRDELGLDFEPRNELSSIEDFDDYINQYKNNDRVKLSKSGLNKIKRYYEKSLMYVADQIVRLIRDIKNKGIFDESLIVIAGDHGEDFLEHNFWGHNTLYDANIRPGMVIKPPADSEINVPNAPDLIDIFPTITKMVSGEVPDQCTGTAWQNKTEKECRITERFGNDNTYSIAIENNKIKAIFSYKTSQYNKPKDKQIPNPDLTEVYKIPRNGVAGEKEIDDYKHEKIDGLLEIAARFINKSDSTSGYTDTSYEPSEEVQERLEELGYK